MPSSMSAGQPAAVTPAAIEAAEGLIEPALRDSPQMLADLLGEHARCRVVVKVETCNPVRSFKGRGCAVLLGTAERGRDVVAASAGNFGQGLAYAARSTGHRVTVVAARTANPFKIDRMRRLGADVVVHGDDFDAAKQRAREMGAAGAGWFVEDGEHPALAIGAGTIGRELDRWPGRLDRVFVPVGNGALAVGIATWLRERRPDAEVVGAVAAGAPAMASSIAAGEVVTTEGVDTIADGIAVRVPTPGAVRLLARLLHRTVHVSDERIRQAMRLCWQDLGLMIEPAGAVSVAAALGDACPGDATVGAVLTGSNVTDDLARGVLDAQLR